MDPIDSIQFVHPVEDLLDEAEQAIFKLAESRVGTEATELKVLLQENVRTAPSPRGRTLTGLDTGYIDLNEMTSGLQDGDMIIIGRPPVVWVRRRWR